MASNSLWMVLIRTNLAGAEKEGAWENLDLWSCFFPGEGIKFRKLRKPK